MSQRPWTRGLPRLGRDVPPLPLRPSCCLRAPSPPAVSVSAASALQACPLLTSSQALVLVAGRGAPSWGRLLPILSAGRGSGVVSCPSQHLAASPAPSLGSVPPPWNACSGHELRAAASPWRGEGCREERRARGLARGVQYVLTRVLGPFHCGWSEGPRRGLPCCPLWLVTWMKF